MLPRLQGGSTHPGRYLGKSFCLNTAISSVLLLETTYFQKWKLTARDNTADTAKPYDHRARDRTLTAHPDIVLAVRQNSRHITLGTSDSQECAKVARTDGTGVGGDGETGNAHDVAGSDEWRAEVELVGKDGHAEGVDGGEYVRGCREEERELGRVALIVENDGEEEGDYQSAHSDYARDLYETLTGIGTGRGSP